MNLVEIKNSEITDTWRYMPATYMSRSCSFRERQKSRTPRTLGYFYPLILSVRQFDDSRAFAQGLVARYICPIFNCSLCYYFLLICRTLGYFYPLILSVRQFDDSRAFAQGLVARYICPIFNCSLCYYFLLICI